MALDRYRQMDNKLSTAIFLTVCYADIFDFPLTFDELYARLVTNEQIPRKRVFNHLEKGKKQILYREGYYYLSGRAQLIKKRRERNINSEQKYDTALSIIKYLSFIPGIRLIGISGSLAVKNCDKSDDIDLFIITEKNMLWIVRFIMVCLLFLFNRKRSTEDKKAQDKICTNMFLSIDSLAISVKKRSLYMAYEIGLMKVIVNKKNTYENFISKNRWAQHFLPHLIPSAKAKQTRSSIVSVVSQPVNNLLFYFQYLYMKKRITREKIGRTFAFFHPIDRENEVQIKLKKRTQGYEKLLPGNTELVKSKKKIESDQVQIASI